MNAVHKGMFGEQYLSMVLTDMGKEVSPPFNRGHDRIVDGIKTEMKFSVASGGKHNTFMLNHLSQNKDWDRCIFMGINLNGEHLMYWMSKSQFRQHLGETPIGSPRSLFSYQQGGKGIKNDDYMTSGTRILQAIERGIFQPMEVWSASKELSTE